METIRAEKARRLIRAGNDQSTEESRASCKNFHEFIRQAWSVVVDDPYVHGWHQDELCKHLEAITFDKFLAKGLDNRFIANVPPGTAKSLTVMVFWQAWEWGPCGLEGMQANCTSFAFKNCIRDSLRFRKLIMSDWFQVRWPCRLTKMSETYIENERGGWRRCMPFGSLMGARAHRLLIDDPHSVDGTESEPDRERAIRNFRETGILRLNDPKRSAIVIIMQRLHDKDLTGAILSLGLPYVHLMLPMRFEVARKCVTPFGGDRRTKEGELLFPERFPRAVLDRDEKGMTAYAIASQFQQRPQPRGGFMFKRWWFKEAKGVPSGARWVRGWDLAASERTTAAFTAGVLLAYHPQERRYYIADVVREQTSNPEKFITRVAENDGRTVEVSIPQDPGAAGKIQAAALCAALAGFRVQASPESGDKVARAQPVADQAEIGNIWIVKGPWNEDFLNEIERFPTGMWLDQVDALSRAFGYFVLRPGAVFASPVIVTSQISIHGSNEGPQ